MLKIFQKLIDQLKEGWQSELAVLKLKALKNITNFLAHGYAVVFVLIFLNTTLLLSGLWLGFFLSTFFDSFSWGFGAAALGFIFLFILILVFKKALLIRPFQNFVIQQYQIYQSENLKPGEDKPEDSNAKNVRS